MPEFSLAEGLQAQLCEPLSKRWHDFSECRARLEWALRSHSSGDSAGKSPRRPRSDPPLTRAFIHSRPPTLFSCQVLDGGSWLWKRHRGRGDHMKIYRQRHRDTPVHTNAHTHAHTHTHTHARADTHVDAHAHAHTHTHSHTRARTITRTNTLA